MYTRKMKLCMLLLIALLLQSGPALAFAPESQEIRADWITDIETERSPGEKCVDPAKVLVAGAVTRVRDKNGVLLKRTSLEEGLIDNDGRCTFRATYRDVPTEDEYAFDVEVPSPVNVDPVTVRRSALEGNDWYVRLTLDTSALLHLSDEDSGNSPAQKSNEEKRTPPSAGLAGKSNRAKDVDVTGEDFELIAQSPDVVDAQLILFSNIKESSLFTEPLVMTFISYAFGSEAAATTGFDTISDHAETNLALLKDSSGVNNVSIGRVGDERRAFLADSDTPALWVVVRQGDQVLSVLAIGMGGDYPQYVGAFLEAYFDDIAGTERSIMPELADLPRGWESLDRAPENVTDDARP